MPIETSDILWRLSTKAGSAGNSQTQGNPNNSLGKYVSTTGWPHETLNGLFDDISGDENAGEAVDYRCVFIGNAHSTLTLLAPVVWVVSQAAGGASVAIGVDTTAASAIGAASAQALEIAGESAAPAGVSFSTPTSKGAGLALGDLAPGQVRAVWVRRTAADTSAVNDDDFYIQVEGDTGA